MEVWRWRLEKALKTNLALACSMLQKGVRHNQSLLRSKSHPVSGRYKNLFFQLTPKCTLVTGCSEDGKCGHISKCISWIHININWSLENASLHFLFQRKTGIIDRGKKLTVANKPLIVLHRVRELQCYLPANIPHAGHSAQSFLLLP